MRNNAFKMNRKQQKKQVIQKNIQNYKIYLKSQLGSGSYSKVYLTQRLTDHKLLAVKVIHKDTFISAYHFNLIAQEIEILKKVDHGNIVKMFDLLQTSKNIYIFIELCEEGDLQKYIRKNGGLDEQHAICFLKDIVEGYRHLYERGITHRDLKPANILLDKGKCKISDFGFSKNLQSGNETVMKSIAGTPLYMSPQILHKQVYTNKCDIWSLGFILYEMLYGHPPFSGKSQLQLVRNISQHHIIFLPHTSNLVQDFITKSLQIKQEDRMSWEQVFKHPLLSQQKEEKCIVLNEFKEKYFIKEEKIKKQCSSQEKIKVQKRKSLSKEKKYEKVQTANKEENINKIEIKIHPRIPKSSNQNEGKNHYFPMPMSPRTNMRPIVHTPSKIKPSSESK